MAPAGVFKDAAVIWRASPPQDTGHGACTASRDRIEITEVRADYAWLYIRARHQMALPGEAGEVHDAVAPNVVLVVDGCPITTPNVSGTIARGWDDPTILTLPLAAVPDGEIEITVEAFGRLATVALRKTGKSIAPLPNEERRGFGFLPAEPSLGLEARVTLGPLPQCDGGLSR